jgi:hypothetical protein
MQVQPNQTVLEAQVLAITPEPDGWGASVELKVLENISSTLKGDSAVAKSDFLQPAKESVIQAFSSEPHLLKVGETVTVCTQLLAGPFGGRTVIESVQPLERARESKSDR